LLYANLLSSGEAWLLLEWLFLLANLSVHLANGIRSSYVTCCLLLMLGACFRPDVLKNEMKVFFVKYNDPIYVKLEKLDIMIRLTNHSNIAQVLAELKESVLLCC